MNHPASVYRPIDYAAVVSIPDIWAIVAQREHIADVVAVQDPHAKPAVVYSYRELYRQIQHFATGLQVLGIQPNSHIALFADNSPRWLIADQGIMTAGGANAVRGAQADRDELLFILIDSQSVALVVQDQALLKKLAGTEPLPVQLVILLTDETPEPIAGLNIFNFSQVMERGAANSLQPVQRQRSDLATLMYTSGTSGKPKGVMLSHGNLMSQVVNCATVVQPRPGERVMSILPIWHSYERTFEYFTFSQGCTQIYTNIRHVKKDMTELHPHYMVSVPRIWESIYEGVQKQFREQPPSKRRLIQLCLAASQRFIEARRVIQGLDLKHLHPSAGQRLTASLQLPGLWLLHQLGDRLVYQTIRTGMGGEFKYIVSGGGSIAEHLEDFFEIIGVEILGGYGLTETAPITHVRRPWRNLRGADGQPLPQTETQIVEPDTRQPLPIGQQGLVLIRGPQVMQGYYNNPQATDKAIDADGWFNTGDLGIVTNQDDLIITGRAKDTIVLTNGENIEPEPIENACLRSVYVQQIMLVGQDQRSIGALIVPNLEALEKWAMAQRLELQPEQAIDLDHRAVQDLFRQELTREVKNRPGYRGDDRIGPFRLISEPFSQENGMMTQTLKLRRHIVMDRYRDMIDEMFA